MITFDEHTFTTIDEDEVMVCIDENGAACEVYAYADACRRTIQALGQIGPRHHASAFVHALDPESAWESLKPLLVDFAG